MDLIQELNLHVQALYSAVEADKKFFASIIHYVRRLKELLTTSKNELTKKELTVLSTKIEEFYKKWRPSGKGYYIPPSQTSDTDSTVREINKLIHTITKLPDSEFKKSIPGVDISKTSEKNIDAPLKPCVFIGHGRSKLWARLKVFLQDELGLATVTYESEPRSGESIVPIIKKMLNQATFAVLVFTGEDETVKGTRRARQNVIHEAGLFQGRLGFKKAILLVQDGVEEFTNVAGLQHIPFSGEKIEQAFYELQRVLKRERQID